jgi:hypothetical protein
MEPLDPQVVVAMFTDPIKAALRSQPDPSNWPSVILDVVKAMPEVRRIDLSHEFHYREFELRVSGSERLRRDAEKLTRFQDLSLTSLPEFVSLTELSPTQGLLLVRYRACAGEDLLPVRHREVVFTEGAKQAFRRDAQVLFERGLFHPYAARGFEHWWTSSESGTIVMDAWTNVGQFRGRDGERALERIDEMLAEGSRG